MGLKIKILIVILIVSIIPTSIVAIFVFKNIIPEYESIISNYFLKGQQEVLKKVIDKTFINMKNTAKDYSIWNEMYEATLKNDKDLIDFYWTSFLPLEPYKFSIVIGINKKSQIIGEYSRYQPFDEIMTDQLKRLFNNVLKEKYKNIDTINDIPVDYGFINLNGHIYSYVCSPVLDDKNLKKPVAGALFLAKDIDSFLSDIRPYISERLYFENHANDSYKDAYVSKVNLYDINSKHIGSIVSLYDEKPLIDIKKRFEGMFLWVFVFLIFLTLLISLLSGMYLSRKIMALEKHAISVFSQINGTSGVKLAQLPKDAGNFENIKVILTYFSNEIKNRILLLKQQDNLLRELFERERKNFEGAIQLLISMIEIKDPYTKGHAERVRALSKKIGQKLITKQKFTLDIFNLEIAAYLHDIGKIVVPESILNKEGRLTDEEYSIVKKHSTYGYNILSKIEYFDNIKDIVLYHHENVDGSGYPMGITKDDIPIESRIISVADVFDALTTDRPYRKAFDKCKAIKFMANDVGKKFDKVVFDAFIDMLYEEKIIDVEMKIDGQI